ncbi:hypothetical protein EV426DRAFT_606697 [Tirmania nivea]|nr:hypothetical protein EV426DRAFT_606697 [Tirmania nivea]
MMPGLSGTPSQQPILWLYFLPSMHTPCPSSWAASSNASNTNPVSSPATALPQNPNVTCYRVPYRPIWATCVAPAWTLDTALASMFLQLVRAAPADFCATLSRILGHRVDVNNTVELRVWKKSRGPVENEGERDGPIGYTCTMDLLVEELDRVWLSRELAGRNPVPKQNEGYRYNTQRAVEGLEVSNGQESDVATGEGPFGLGNEVMLRVVADWRAGHLQVLHSNATVASEMAPSFPQPLNTPGLQQSPSTPLFTRPKRNAPEVEPLDLTPCHPASDTDISAAIGGSNVATRKPLHEPQASILLTILRSPSPRPPRPPPSCLLTHHPIPLPRPPTRPWSKQDLLEVIFAAIRIAQFRNGEGVWVPSIESVNLKLGGKPVAEGDGGFQAAWTAALVERVVFDAFVTCTWEKEIRGEDCSSG